MPTTMKKLLASTAIAAALLAVAAPGASAHDGTDVTKPFPGAPHLCVVTYSAAGGAASVSGSCVSLLSAEIYTVSGSGSAAGGSCIKPAALALHVGSGHYATSWSPATQVAGLGLAASGPLSGQVTGSATFAGATNCAAGTASGVMVWSAAFA